MAETHLQPATSSVGVSIEGVNLSYGRTHVLKDVDLTIEPGEFFAFLGPSGCGKTTLLRLIAGFAACQTGRVLIGDEDVTTLPPWARNVGMVFQSYALWPHMTVRKNVAFGLEEQRVPRREIRGRVDAALELVGLLAYADRRPSQLSGGQQQRVALARTLVVEPRVLLLDEPLSNLDAKLRVEMRHELVEMQRKLGLTTIFVTHDQEEANTISQRIAVLEDGRIQQVGTPMGLYDRPANLFVANFLGTANVIPGEVVAADGGAQFRAEGLAFALPAGSPGPQSVLFRPQAVAIQPGEDARPAAGAIVLPGRVDDLEFLGNLVRYRVAVGPHRILVEVPYRPDHRPIPPGQAVTLHVPTDQVSTLTR